MSTNAILVLSIGLDPAITAAHQRPSQSMGVFLHVANTPGETLTTLRNGDFDVVLIGSAIALEVRRQIMAAIRSLGFRIPLVYVTDNPDDTGDSADLTIIGEGRALDLEVIALLATGRSKIRPIRPVSHSIAMHRARVHGRRPLSGAA